MMDESGVTASRRRRVYAVSRRVGLQLARQLCRVIFVLFMTTNRAGYHAHPDRQTSTVSVVESLPVVDS